MAWSTREMAELAGTSLRAVRHCHDIGLLDGPERFSSGYEQYGVSHPVRLLRIKRLAALGFSLSRIADMRDGPDADPVPRDLPALDEESAAAIERLRHARAEVGAHMRRTATTDLPLRLASVDGTAELPDPDRSLVTVLGTVLGPSGMDAYADSLREKPQPVARDLDELPADADEPARRTLAECLVPYVRGLRAKHPGLSDLASDAPRGRQHTARTIGKAMTDLYNPPQFDVMRRLHTLLSATGDPR
ncbi:MerR family transcriptional regulator [Streptomyces sp. CA-278952]|uniref:MerR family transcriptional regulator n=1 Tax=Streptomyces sp. CA-278952 TaxID=2980556 RepID=UPI00236876AC|nr:MerR family transcriptional regulator [Streptomyces sp. CA-278952]WDG28139.1 MerR family transcriptional regulator [Streptomyces sp. CA-278952]